MEDHNEVLIGTFGVDKLPNVVSIGMFDLDDTLIQPTEKVRPGAPYTKWAFCKGVLKKLASVGNNSNRDTKDINSTIDLLVIISNQAKLNQYRESFQQKISDVIKELQETIKVPVLVYVANGYNKFRKPSTGIITEFLIPRLHKEGVTTIAKWFYVGDAAGRQSDHSDSDRKFALNINMLIRNSKIDSINVSKLIFMEPEVYFLGKQPSPFTLSGFDPKKFINGFLNTSSQNSIKLKMSDLNTSIDYLKLETNDNKQQEVILLIGPPGIGKSALATQIEKKWNYVRINQDTLGTKDAVDKKIKQTLQSGKSVVLDSTNSNAKRRKEQIAIALAYFREHNKPIHIRAFVMAGDLSQADQRALAEHLNIVRERNIRQPKTRVPDIVYRKYYKEYTSPTESEGFTDIVNVKFVPKFSKPIDALHFLQWS